MHDGDDEELFSLFFSSPDEQQCMGCSPLEMVNFFGLICDGLHVAFIGFVGITKILLRVSPSYGSENDSFTSCVCIRYNDDASVDDDDDDDRI